ncbi:MAG: hypothetical protein R3C59_28195 [Planctomycetaceae bacterium]
MLISSWLKTFRSRLQTRSTSRRRTPDSRRAPSQRAEDLEVRSLLTSPELVAISPNFGSFVNDGSELTTSPRELNFQFSPGQVLDELSLGAIQITGAGFDGTFGDGNEIPIQGGFVGLTDRPDTVVFRFAQALPDDTYRIDILGSGPNPLQNVDGEAFSDGNDLSLNFSVNLGAQVQAVVPQPVIRQQIVTISSVASLMDGDTVTISNGLISRTFEFEDVTGGPGNGTGGNTTVTFTSGDSTATVAGTLATAINAAFAGGLTATPNGNLVTLNGSDFDPEVQVVTTTAGAVANTAGGIQQRRETIIVYFNEDTLDGTSAQTSDFYRLINTSGTLAAGDDTVTLPNSVVYDAVNHRAVLTFASIPNGTFRLKIGSRDEVIPPRTVMNVAPGPADDNSSFATRTVVGALTDGGATITSQIEPQLVSLPPSPGGLDEPGHRDIPIGDELHSAIPGFPVNPPSAIPTRRYYFPDFYGNDPEGNPLFNQITEAQKERIREIYELYSNWFGFEVEETSNSGTAVIVGDIRQGSAISFPPSVSTGGGSVILSAFNGAGQSDDFGGSLFNTALHEIGHSIGLGHAFDVPSVMGNGAIGEDQYPTYADIIHGRGLYPLDSTDIDLYEFDITEEGLFTAEIVAERLTATSQLNSALRLYRENANGSKTLIAQNDDYYSNDAYLELNLTPGKYFIGVSASGNTDYDPTVSDTGFGGGSDGNYNLELDFQKAAASTIIDTTGVAFDGDADGTPGGDYEFDFRSGLTVFVDKSAPSAGAAGTEANPYNRISQALAAPGPNQIIRIVGNGGADNDLSTVGDNQPYLIGRVGSTDLEDGRLFAVPAGVVVQVDAGVSIKLQGSVINVGSVPNGPMATGGALQILGTPEHQTILTSYRNDAVGGDSDGVGSPAPGNWGGVVFRDDSDFQAPDALANPDLPGVFLNYINHAHIEYGGGFSSDGVKTAVFSPVHLETARPTVTHNLITLSASHAISANPNSFDDSRGRIGPDIYRNLLEGNSINGLFVRSTVQNGVPLDLLTRQARFDDTDITHVITQSLEIYGGAGGSLNGSARTAGRLAVDPGIVVKMAGARIEADRGAAHLIAEGTVEDPVIFTSLFDDRFGAGGTFDTTGDADTQTPAPGDWSGLIFNAVSRASIDHAYIAYAGGASTLGTGGLSNFNTIEAHHGAKVRLANSTLQFNADGNATDNRDGRGVNNAATVFVRQAQPIIVNNIFVDNFGPLISINANAMTAVEQRDTGRSTGVLDVGAQSDLDPLKPATQFADNYGPLVRLNRTENNDINGLSIRGETLTTESVWDDTDIVHVLRDEIVVNYHHTFSGLRLQSAPDASLVVKLQNTLDSTGNVIAEAGFTADGTLLDIEDRIGGTVQVIGQPKFPVVLTSLQDCTVGAGLTPEGLPQNFTDNACVPASTSFTPQVIDVVILLDDTGSFSASGLTLATVFPQIVSQLAIDLAGADFAYSVARYEDYATDTGRTGEFDDRPFILNQPLITPSTPDFALAIDSALNRTSPGFGGDAPESGIEALWQIATGAGFDGNLDGDTTDSGPAGLVATQTVVSPGGDVPAFSTFMADPTGPVLPPVGTGGGVGWRSNADEKIIIIATDVGFQYQDDGLSTYTGVGGVTVPATVFSNGGRLDSPGGNGATIQATVDRLIADGIKVVGMGDGFSSQAPLMALSSLTGAVDGAGNPLFFPISPDNASEITAGIIGAITQSVTNNASAGDWRSLQFFHDSNDRNVRTVLEGERANNSGVEANNTVDNAQILGTLAPNQKSGDDNQPLGFEIHGSISADDPGDVDLYQFRFRSDGATPIWFDVDMSRGNSLDSVVEVIEADGTLLARSTGDGVNYGTITGFSGATAEVLEQFDYNGGDFYSTNFRDAGMRVVLPDTGGAEGIFYVRIRSNSSDLNVIDGGLTSGEYQLELRLQQQDEKPGSTVRYADIRYATNGIEVFGLPAHSPLLGESGESTNTNGTLATAVRLGNLLESDNTTFSFAGNLQSGNDLDLLRFNVDYATTALGGAIQAIGGVNGGAKTWSTVFDLDYANGLTRANSSMVVYQVIGGQIVPVLIGRESNVEDDQPLFGEPNNDSDDLTRGSAGKLDPFIGPVQLPTGIPGSLTEYAVGVFSDSQLLEQLNQTYQSAADNPLIRLEPVNSVTRIIEDHIGFQGYKSQEKDILPYDEQDGLGGKTNPEGLFNITSATTLQTEVRPLRLSDVPLFVSSIDRLETVDPFFGTLTTDLGNLSGNTNFETRDIVMRSDGTLWGYQRIDGYTGNGSGDNGTAGRLVQIDPGTGNVTVRGNDNVLGSVATPDVSDGTGNTPGFEELTFTDDVDALAWERSGGVDQAALYALYYSVREHGRGNNGLGGTMETDNSKLYRANPDSGSATKDIAVNNQYGVAGDIQPTGVTFSTGFISVSDGNGAAASIRLQARAPGSQGNGITVNIVRGDFANAVTVSTSGLAITLQIDNNPNANAGAIIDAINRHSGARQLVTAGLNSGAAGEGGVTVGGGLMSTAVDGPIGPLNGAVTGMAFGDFHGDTLLSSNTERLYGVTERGEFLRIRTDTGLVERYVDLTSVLPPGATGFQGLALGPQNVEGGAYSQVLFAITNNGALVALDPTIFTPGTVAQTDPVQFAPASFLVSNVFDVNGDGVGDSATIQLDNSGEGSGNSSLLNPTGLAFSPLDFNLWHPTTRRGNDAGHGINELFDGSRVPSAEPVTLSDSFGHNYDTFQSQGGASFYFGLEQYAANGGPYLNYESEEGQLGVLNHDVQRDLTSNPAIGNNYNLPGGAYGSLTTKPFDLTSETGSQSANDAPTLYFNYFLASEDTNTNTPNGDMRDSARAYISTDGGTTWELLATNNVPNVNGGWIGEDSDAEVPDFISHTRNADSDNTAEQQVQPLWDNTGTWRQARVDLANYVGQTGLILRFDFSTAGTIVDLVSSPGTPAASNEDSANDIPSVNNNTVHPDLATPQDEYGNLNDHRRGANNNFEGFYIDDIIIGWAERGEMISAATTNVDMFTVPRDQGQMAPIPLLTGAYQVEIRRGDEFGAPLDADEDGIQIGKTVDTNRRFVDGQSLGLTQAQDDFNLDGLTNVTSIFDFLALSNFDFTQFVDFSELGWNAFDAAGGWARIPASGTGGSSVFGDETSSMMQAGAVTGVLPPELAAMFARLDALAQTVPPAFGGPFNFPIPPQFNNGLEAGTQSELTVTVPVGAGQVEFDYRFDPDAGHDRFEIWIGSPGEGAPAFSSTESTIGHPMADGNGFVKARFSVTPGVHTFTFIYGKDSTGSNTLGSLVLDNVVFPDPDGGPLRGDSNVVRQQGHFQIEGNIIRDIANDGIHVEADDRDPGTGFASLGTPINFGFLNAGRLAPGVTIANNIVARFGASGSGSGIYFAGENVGGNVPPSAVPFGKIINNTIYGGNAERPTNGTVGIDVAFSAAPSMLNNLIVNTETGVRVDGTSSGSILARTYFRGNTASVSGIASQNQLPDNPANLLFVNPSQDNFYLAGDTDPSPFVYTGALPIDRSLEKLDDRTAFVNFKNPLGIPRSDIITPRLDAYGQARVDDPSQLGSGTGGEIFADIGAVERSDFEGPFATIVVPEDNTGGDLDPSVHDVVRIVPTFLQRFIVRLNDDGIGVDDATVSGSQWELRKNGVLLQQNIDYTFIYNTATNEVIFQAVTVFATDSRYTITLTERDPQTTVRDLAGNLIAANRLNGDIRFEIVLDNGVNDAPVNSVPTTAATPEDTTITFSQANGNAIRVSDQDIHLGNNQITVTLFAEHGTIPATAGQVVGGPLVTFSNINVTGATQVRLPNAATVVGQSMTVGGVTFSYVDASVVAAPTREQIAVDVVGNATAAQVASATVTAINGIFLTTTATVNGVDNTRVDLDPAGPLASNISSPIVASGSRLTLPDGNTVIGDHISVGGRTFTFVDAAVVASPVANQIAVNDFDSSGAVAIATANALNLEFAGTTASVVGNLITLSDVTVRGITPATGVSVISVSGSADEVNQYLNGLQFRPADDYHGRATLTVLSEDAGQYTIITANRFNQTDVDTIAITVTPVNDQPLAGTVPDQNVVEDTDVVAPAGVDVQTVTLNGIMAGPLNETELVQVTATVDATTNIAMTTGIRTIGASLTVNSEVFRFVNAAALPAPVAGITDIPVFATDSTIAVASAATTAINDRFAALGATTPLARQLQNTVSLSLASTLVTTTATDVFVITNQDDLLDIVTTQMIEVAYTFPGTSATISYRPKAQAYGIANVTVTMMDAGVDRILVDNPGTGVDESADNLSITRTFAILVSPENDNANLDPIVPATITLPEQTTAVERSIPLTGINAGQANELDDVRVTATVAPTAVVAIARGNNVVGETLTVGGVIFRYVSAAGVLPNEIVIAPGDSTFDVATKTANAINSSVLGPIAVAAANYVTINIASGLVIGSTNDAVDSFHIMSQTDLIQNVWIEGFTSRESAGDAILHYTPGVSEFGGPVTVTVTAEDAGIDGLLSTTGDNGSTSRSITILLTPVNDAPLLGANNDQDNFENDGPRNVTLTGIAAGPDNELEDLELSAAQQASLIIAFSSGDNVLGQTLTIDNGINPPTDFIYNTSGGSSTTIGVLATDSTFMVAQKTADAINAFFGLGTAVARENYLTIAQPWTATGSYPAFWFSTDADVVTGLTVGPYTSRDATANVQYNVEDAFGSVPVTVTLTDAGLDGISGNGDDIATDRTFRINVSAVNDLPTLDVIVPAVDLSNEENGEESVTLTGISAGRMNELENTRFLNASIAATRSVAFAPGSRIVGQILTVSGTPFVYVNLANGPAGVNQIGINLTDSTQQVAAATAAKLNSQFGPGAAVVTDNTITTTRTVTGSTSYFAVMEAADIIAGSRFDYVSRANTGTFHYTPSTVNFGQVTVTLTLQDAGVDGIFDDVSGTARDESADNRMVSRSFTITVAPHNDSPTLNAIVDQPVAGQPSINEDSGQYSVNLTGLTAGAVNELEDVALTATVSGTSVAVGIGANVIGKSLTFNGASTFTFVATGTATSSTDVEVDATDSTQTVATKLANAVNLAGLGFSVTAYENTVNTAVSVTTTAADGFAIMLAADMLNIDGFNYTSRDTTGTLLLTPLANAFGQVIVTVTATDAGIDGLFSTAAGNASSSQSFVVTLTPMNDRPTIDVIPNQPAAGQPAINEDSGAHSVVLTGITAGVDNELEDLNLTATIRGTSVAVGAGQNVLGKSLVVNGTTFNYVAVGAAQSNLDIEVSGANSTQSVASKTAIAINAAGIGVAATSFQNTVNMIANVTTTATDGIVVTEAASLIRIDGFTYTSRDASQTGTLHYTPLDNAFGQVTVTVTATDNGIDGLEGTAADNEVFSRTFTISLSPDNDLPTLDPIADQPVSGQYNEDSGQRSVGLTGITAGIANELEDIQFSASVSGTSVAVGAGANVTGRSLTFNGVHTFTFVAPGTSTSATEIEVAAGDSTQVVAMKAATAINAAGLAGLTVTSSDNTISTASTVTTTATDGFAIMQAADMVTIDSFSYVSRNAAGTGTLFYTPKPNAFGQVTVTVTATDAGVDGFFQTTGDNRSVSQSFTLTLTPVNDPPVLNAIPNQPTSGQPAVNEDSGQHSVGLTGIATGADNELEDIVLTATVSGNSVAVGSGANVIGETLTLDSTVFRFVASAVGAGVTDIVVDAADSSQIVATKAAAVINSTTGTTGVSVTVYQNTINTAATATVSSGRGLAVRQALSMIRIDQIDYPARNPAGTATLLYTPLLNAFGQVTVTVTATDAGVDGLQGTALGNEVASRSFTLNLAPVNDLPTINAVATQTVAEDSGANSVTLTGISPGANELQDVSITATIDDTSVLIVPSGGDAVGKKITVGGEEFTYVTALSSGAAASHEILIIDVVTLVTVDSTFEVATATASKLNAFFGAGTATAFRNTVNTALTVGTLDNPFIAVPAAQIIQQPTVTYTSRDTTGTLLYRTLPNAFGQVTVTLTVQDAGLDGLSGTADDGLVQRKAVINVDPKNDLPTLDPIGNILIPVDAGLQTVDLTGITNGPFNELHNVRVTVTSSDPAFIPTPIVQYIDPQNVGTLTFTPTAGVSGAATITVTVEDAGVDGVFEDSVTPELEQADNLSVVRTFRVSTPPIVQSPTGSITNSTPLLSWTAIPGTSAYTVELTNITDGTIVTPGNGQTAANSLQITTPLPMAEYELRVRSRDALGVEGLWSVPVRFSVTLAPEILSPSSDRIPDSTPTFSWNAVPGADSYNIVVVDDTTNLVVFTRTGLTTLAATVPNGSELPLGRYRYTVTAVNSPSATSTGAAVQASASGLVTVSTPAEILMPFVAIYDTTPTVTWTPVVGAVRHELEVFNVTTNSVEFTVSDITGTSYTVPDTDALGVGEYRARVRSFGDVAGTVVSDWSTVHVFLVGTAPVLLGPSGGIGTAPFFRTVDTRPAFSWEGSLNGETYEIWWNSVTENRNLFVVDGITEATYTPTEDLPVGRYRVWVRAKTGTSEPSAWSRSYDFEVVTPPTINQFGTSTFNDQPTITWNAQQDVDRWDVWVNVVNGNNQATLLFRDQDVSTNSFTFPETVPNGRYRIWVRGFATNSESGQVTTTQWSNVYQFDVGGRPRLTVPTTTTDTTPTISWSTVQLAASYELSMTTADAIGSPILLENGIGATSYTFDDLAPGDYRVWVRARALDGRATPWSLGSESFMTITTVQQQPLLPPVLNAVTLSAGRATVTWSTVPGAVQYEVYLGTQANPGQRFIPAAFVINNTFTTPSALPADNYRFWVRSIDGSGKLSTWSAPSSFTVVSNDVLEQDDERPVLLASLDGAEMTWMAESVTVSQLPVTVTNADPANPVKPMPIPVNRMKSRQATEVPQAEVDVFEVQSGDELMAAWDDVIWAEESAASTPEAVVAVATKADDAVARPTSVGWLAGLAAFTPSVLRRRRNDDE